MILANKLKPWSIEQGKCTYLTRVVTWVRNSEIDSSVAKSVEEEGSFDEFSSFPSVFSGAEAFDDAPLPTFKRSQKLKKKKKKILET